MNPTHPFRLRTPPRPHVQGDNKLPDRHPPSSLKILPTQADTQHTFSTHKDGLAKRGREESRSSHPSPGNRASDVRLVTEVFVRDVVL